jgi:hypothetical protein
VDLASVDQVGGEQRLSLYSDGEGDDLDGLHVWVYVAADLTAFLASSDLGSNDFAGPLDPAHE